MIPLDRIRTGLYQPRKEVAPDDGGLLESVQKLGVLEPVLVRREGDHYELIAGHRRYEAALRAGLEAIPARVLEVGPEEAWWVAVSENLARRDLSTMEKLLVVLESLRRVGVEDPERLLKDLYSAYQVRRHRVIEDERYKKVAEVCSRMGLKAWTVVSTWAKYLFLVPDPEDRELLARMGAPMKVLDRWHDPAFRERVRAAWAEGRRREEATLVPGEVYARRAAERRERGTATLRRALKGALRRLEGRARELAEELLRVLEEGGKG